MENNYTPFNNNNKNYTYTTKNIKSMSISSGSTLQKIEDNRHVKRLSDRSGCVFYDRSYPAYNWLLPGWVAEERHMDHGRIYKYFYDPAGNQYKSKAEVLNAWEESGLVLLDD